MCWRHRNSEELNTAKLAAKVPSTTDTVVTEFYSESADEGICATANPVRPLHKLAKRNGWPITS